MTLRPRGHARVWCPYLWHAPRAIGLANMHLQPGASAAVMDLAEMVRWLTGALPLPNEGVNGGEGSGRGFAEGH
jgi:hypothetical protein